MKQINIYILAGGISLALFSACGKVRQLTIDDSLPEPHVEMLHETGEYRQTFSLRMPRQLNVKALDEKGAPVKGETFLFSLTPNGSPFTSVVTDNKGEIKTSVELPTSVKEVYVRPQSGAVRAEQTMQVAGDKAFVYTNKSSIPDNRQQQHTEQPVTSQIEEAVAPVEKADTLRLGDEEVFSTDYYFGTLAFEDFWPEKGDYDFNDVVIRYEYGLEVNARGVVTGVRMVFTPIAVGALNANGFGIQLPIRTADCAADFLEEGNTQATVILTNDVHSAFRRGGIVNTEKGKPRYAGTTYIVNLKLQPSVQLHRKRVRFGDFNPFIFARNRSHEIHLPGKHPTEKADRSLFGTKSDCSVPEKGLFYRMDNHYPWALDIPRKDAGSPAWRYPYERVTVTQAYPNYLDWTQDWYDTTNPANVNEEWVTDYK